MTSTPAIWAAAFAGGAAFGALYLTLLWASVRALTGERGVAAFVALAVARAALVLGALVIALALGAQVGELAAAAAGFLAVRVVIVRGTGLPRGRLTWK